LAFATLAFGGCSDDNGRAGNGGSDASAATSTSVDAETVAFCQEARSLEDAIEIDPQNPDSGEIGRTAEALEELSALAPREINAQVSSAGQLLREFSDLLASVDVSDPAALSDPGFQERLASLQERDATLGSDLQEIVRFIEVECAAGGGEMDDSTS
jgi:hypothetical protein